jgi:hypothetical protein
VAKDSSGKVRDFKYGEGATVNSQMFAGGPGSGFPGWGGGGNKPGYGGGGGLRITSAKWGFGAQQSDVTGRLQGMVRNNRVYVKVDPKTMCGDPSPGVSKLLTVFYNWNGRGNSTVVQEGAYLSVP